MYVCMHVEASFQFVSRSSLKLYRSNRHFENMQTSSLSNMLLYSN
uniref:Uncharacterized protein n=1 Tax=Arundo donax TaxID=35708 RepID=A0A0A9F470_ARUDO